MKTMFSCRPCAPESGYYATTAFADYAIEYLRDHARDHSQQPFFLYLAFIAPHFPLHALPEDIAQYRDRYLEGWDAVRDQRWRRLRAMEARWQELDAEFRRHAESP